MTRKTMGKNLILVAFSRFLSLLSGIVVGLLLPKILSITDYGYYKVFTLYAVYTALLHFGFVDGILLKLAGKDFSELEHERLRTYTRFFIALEGVLSLAMVLFGALLAKGEYRFVVIMLALNMMFVNITTYYQFLSQATQRFREYSAKSLIVSLLKVLFVGALFVLDYFDITAVSHRIYLIGLNVLDLGMAVWYVAIYRGITFGKGLPIRFLKDDIRDIFKTGIVLTLAYQVSHLVLALDRQFVNLLFSMEIFSVYSFAYNIVGMISTMISSLSIVLLPMLKRCTKEDVVGHYRTSMTVVSIVTAGTLLCYFPFASLIECFLPQYAGALEYIAIVLPTLLFTSGISVVMFTVEKVLDSSFAFFKTSCIALVIGLITNALAYIIFRTPQAISYASLLVMAIWFLLEGSALERKIHVKILRELVYLILISVGFLMATTYIGSFMGGIILFTAVLMLLTILFYFRFIKECAFTLLKKRS